MAKQMFLLFIIHFLAFLSLIKCENDQIEVRTGHGPFVGEKLKFEASKSVYRFLGIPYAKPPTGSLRFQRTHIRDSNTTEPLKTQKWPVKCTQNPAHFFNIIDHTLEHRHDTSEDCLFLNVWTPAVDVDSSELRPVIMYIHGGGLFVGSTGIRIYDGERLSQMADAVVVTIHYRLATLGFFYSDKVDGIKGNQGLWDQTMALRWIHDHIRLFGGDRNKITVIGESAGSWSVSALILSPVARNLFHNAFMMSAALDDRFVGKPERVVATYLKGIRKVGCAKESDKSITEEVMKCINKLEPEKISKIVELMNDKMMTFPPLFTMDGEFFTDLPYEMLKKGDFKTDINLVVSTVANEGSFLMSHLDQFRPKNPTVMSLEETKKFIGKFMNDEVLFDNKIDTEKLGKVYFSGLNPLDDGDISRNRATSIYGDWLLTCPVNNFARAIKLNSGGKASVFQMVYKVKSGKPKHLCSKWGDACHMDDIYSLFGIPFQDPKNHVDREREVATEVIAFIYDFIRTGKPNIQRPEWEEYFLIDNKTVVAPYYELTTEATTPKNFKFGFKHDECQLINKHI